MKSNRNGAAEHVVLLVLQSSFFFMHSFAATANVVHACCLMNCPSMVAGSISYASAKLTILQGGRWSVGAVQHRFTVCQSC